MEKNEKIIDQENEVLDTDVKYIGESIQEYMDSEKLNDEGYTATLYKYKGKSKRKTVCYQYEDEVPEKHEVGVEFGSGRYILMISWHDSKKFKSFSFQLHENYDKLMKDKHPDKQTDSTAVIQDNSAQIMTLMQNQNQFLMTMMMKMVEKQNQAQNFDMGIMYENMNNMHMKMLEDQMSFRKKVLKDSDIDIYDEEEEPTLIEQIVGMVEDYLPMFLGDNGKVAQSMAIRQAKSQKEYQEIVSDPAKLKMLVKKMDSSKGKAVTDKLLKTLGVERPE